ncbi:MAG: hypothetical protein AAGI66_01525 [Cyanobacteria bacterium P01_H01_bin.74]
MATHPLLPLSLPEHYKCAFKVYLRYAIIMTVFGLLMGIIYQESSKKAPISDALPAGAHLEAVLHLGLVHGHAFLIGVLIPLAVNWMLTLGLLLGAKPIGSKSLKIGTWLYLPSSVIAIALMIYKGYHYVLGVRGGQFDLLVLHHTLFGGNHVIRAIVYASTHTAMAVGLSIIAIQVWKSLSAKKSTVS